MKFPLVITSIFLALPTVIFAQDKVYSPLVDLSNAGQGNDVQSFEQYINFLYGMSIAVAALLAVIKIIIAGAKYMLEDLITGKEDAKKDIQGAVLGLLLIISAVVILELINPTLIKKEIKFDKFQSGRGDLHSIALRTVNGESSGQLADKLTTGLSSCITKTNGIAGPGNTILVTGVSVANCTSADSPGALLATVVTRCRDEGGTPRLGQDGKSMGCAVPGAVVEKKSINEYKTTSDNCLIPGYIPVFGGVGCTDVILERKYLSQNGQLVTYNAEAFCKEKHPTMNLSACTEEVEDAFMISDDWGTSGSLQDTYCQNNAGISKSRFTCELPAKTLSSTEATAMYQKKDSGVIIVSKTQFEEMCKQALGSEAKLVDTKRTWVDGVADYTCAVYKIN